MSTGPSPLERPPRNRAKWLRSFAIVLILGTCAVLLPCCQKVEGPSNFGYSQFSLRYVGLCLQSYHEINGMLPPAVVTDRNGKPLYSWRVLLLPYLDEVETYREFKLDEPWDSPHNKKLCEKIPRCYQAENNDAPPGHTHYQVLVGPGTAFERPGLKLTLGDFPDGLTETILVVEASTPVPWAKPDDLVYDPNGPLPPMGGLFEVPIKFLCYPVGRRPGFNAVFADTKVRFIPSSTAEATLRALITRNGGEPVDVSRFK